MLSALPVALTLLLSPVVLGQARTYYLEYAILVVMGGLAVFAVCRPSNRG